MKQPLARIVSSRRRTKILLAVVIAFVLVAAASVGVLRSGGDRTARLAETMPGASLGPRADYPPMWHEMCAAAGGANPDCATYTMMPGHLAGVERYLTRNTWLAELFSRTAYVVLWDWDDGNVANRRWAFLRTGTGAWRIKSRYSSTLQVGGYLAVYGASGDAGADVVTHGDSGGDNHLWLLRDAGDGMFQIESKSSGMCLDIRDAATGNGAALVQQPCDLSRQSQHWRLTPVW